MLRVAKFLIKNLIYFSRPLIGFMGERGRYSLCVYPTSCMDYALDVFEQKNFFVAIFLITKRLLLCNPLGAWFLYR